MFRAVLLLGAAGCLAVLAWQGYERLRTFGGPWAFRLLSGRLDEALATQRILSTEVEARFDPAAGLLAGEARLRYEAAPEETEALYLLLNPGLRVEGATVNGARAPVQRRGMVVAVRPPEGSAGEGRFEVTLRYRGRPDGEAAQAAHFGGDEVLLPMLSFWHPLNLHSFTEFSASITLPPGWVAVGGGALGASTLDGGQVHQWTEARPVLGAPLIAGRYAAHTRRHGATLCRVYVPEGAGHEELAERLLQMAGDLHTFYGVQFGPDEFPSVAVVASGIAETAWHGGNSTAVLPLSAALAGERLFVDLARTLAGNWWGGTVGGRWFSPRPEASEWIVTGLSEYSAWLALAHFGGRAAQLAHLEGLECPPSIGFPMKTLGLGQRFTAAGAHEAYNQVRGPYVAARIAARIGQAAFLAGCQNYLAVHRHRTASYAALRHELELASETDLEEQFRVWFDRPGLFDYAITSVEERDSEVVVTVRSEGDIPLMAPVEIAVTTEIATHIHTIQPGPFTSTHRFEIRHPLRRVTLDPFFQTPDMRRSNNVWPRRQWPQRIGVARNGYLAVSAVREWPSGPGQVAAWRRAYDAPRTLPAGVPLAARPLWAPDSQSVLLAGEAASLWTPGGASRGLGGGSIAAGWFAGGAGVWREGALRKLGGNGGGAEYTLAEPPAAGSLRPHPETAGRFAYIGKASGRLHVHDAAAGGAVALPSARPAGDVVWTDEGAALLYLERGGTLYRATPGQEEAEELLTLRHDVADSALSRWGRYAAWRDADGALRVAERGRVFPRLITLPGQVTDYEWEGENALVCLVSERPRLLPSAFHGEHGIWRIATADWQPERLAPALDAPWEP